MAGQSPAHRAKVASYYDEMQPLYGRFWDTDGLHYGLWNRRTFTLRKAVSNMNAFVAERLDLQPGMRVLDAGCGVGGTARYLAREHGATVTGITISPIQLAQARERSRTARDGVSYELRDFTDTTFDAGSYDRAFALESACYAERKEGLLEELHRVLCPGGRVVVADGFRARRGLGRRALHDYRRFCDGWALPGLDHVDDFGAKLEAAGFDEVEYVDLRRAVLPTAVILEGMAAVGWLTLGAVTKANWLPRRWYDHGMACLSQRRLFQKGALTYGVFCGRRSQP